MEQQSLLAIGIFLISYGLIITGTTSRTLTAMAGGLAMILLGVTDQAAAIQHIDFNVLALLAGLMLMGGITADTGLIPSLTVWTLSRNKGRPLGLLASTAALTALGSAFLDNAVVLTIMLPFTLQLSRRLGLQPLPFLLALLMSANVGSTATLIGSIPNMMIGSGSAKLGYMDFLKVLAPLSIVLLALHIGAIYLLFRRKLHIPPERRQQLLEREEALPVPDPALLLKTGGVLLLTLTGFLFHQPLQLETGTVALGGAFLLLLLTGTARMEDSFSRMEWSVLFLIVGLYMLSSGLAEVGTFTKLAERGVELANGNELALALMILWGSAISSALIDNVPYTAVMVPFIQELTNLEFSNPELLWWSLALGAGLGANGTLIGASSNLLAAKLSFREGSPLYFGIYLKYGAALTLVSIMMSHLYIILRFLH